MIAGMTYYQICMYFLLYSFLGWTVEVIYHAVTLGRVVNRGFLNGPVCPVYGFGMLAILALTHLLSSSSFSGRLAQMNPLLLFFFGMLLATAVELAAGWLLDRLFHARWWDYSSKPFNLHGYICLEFSILWGLAVVLVVKIIHPLLSKNTAESIPPAYGWPVMAVFYLIYLIDLIVTVLTVSGMNKKLKELDHIRTLLREPSDKLSEMVGSTSVSTMQHVEEGQVQAALAKAEAEELAEEKKARLEKRADELRSDLAGHTFFGTGRLLKAFPSIRHEQYRETLDELKNRLRI